MVGQRMRAILAFLACCPAPCYVPWRAAATCALLRAVRMPGWLSGRKCRWQDLLMRRPRWRTALSRRLVMMGSHTTDNTPRTWLQVHAASVLMLR